MLTWSPLKLATPLEATTDVVPLAKLPEESVTLIGVVVARARGDHVAELVLDGHSGPEGGPGRDEDEGGCVVMTSLLGRAATVKLLVVAEVTAAWVVSETVTV